MEPPASTFAAEFGRRAERRRRILGLTQRQVGERIGLQRSHISQLEGGAYQSMKLEQLAMLAEVLQTTTDYLLQRVAEDPGPVPPLTCREEGPCPESSSPLLTTAIPERTAADGHCTSFP